MKRKTICSIVVVLVIMVGIPTVFAKTNGKPFQAIWDAITDLQDQVDKIELIPGPQGESGSEGPQGESNWDEERIYYLEERLAYLENLHNLSEPPPGEFLASAYLQSNLSQHLSIDDSQQNGLDIAGDISIEAWVMFMSFPPNPGTHAIVEKGSESTYAYGFYLNYLDFDTVRMYFTTTEDGSTWSRNDYVDWDIQIGTWYHLAVTRTGTTHKFYINGVQEGSTITGQSVFIYDSADPLCIGLQGSKYFDGLIDEVRVWSDERTLAEINDNKDIELIGNEPNLQGYWKFNGNALDSSPNGNHLTNHNGVTFVAD